MKKTRVLMAAIIAALLFTASGAMANMVPANGIGEPLPSLGMLDNGLNELSAQGDIRLSYDLDERIFNIEDLASGKTWQTGVTGNQLDLEAAGLAGTAWENNYRSLYSFVYVDTSNNRARPQTIYSESESAQLIAEKIQDGARLTYVFGRIGITVVVEAFLQGGRLALRIPADGIVESGTNVVLTIDLAPFMGASNQFSEGYVLLPVGSGAVVGFGSFIERPGVSPMEFGIYGRKYVWPWDYINNSATEQGYYEALLPLYGINTGDTGILAVAYEGAFDASIMVTPATDTLPLTNVCFRFTMRYQFDVMLSNLSGGSATFMTQTDRERIMRDCVVTIEFLSGKDADYSGMARIYRKSLQEQGMLPSVPLTGEMPLGLEFFMGAQEGRTFGNVYIPMTTYSQAADIVKLLVALGVEDMDVSLNAWARGGYGRYPSLLKPESKLGGRAGFINLSNMLEANGIPLYARINYVRADGGNSGFSQRNDVVLEGSGIQNRRFNMFILRASAANRMFNRGLRAFSGLGAGVVFEQAGLYLYHDYNRSGILSPRSETAIDIKALLSSASNAGLAVAMEGANGYLLSGVTRIYDMPIHNGGYILFDESVPFLSMVLHGLIQYTANPGNLFYNESKQFLTWVEYGAMPFYQLTYEHPQELKYTEANWLFSGMADDWAHRAANRYMQMKERLGVLWGRQMLSHFRPVPGVARMEYEGGYMVYINYNDESVAIDGLVLAPLDFLVVPS